jgi:hypothetical protein
MDAALAQYLSYAAATQLLATGHPGAAAVEMSQAGGGDAANPGLYVAQAKADYVAAVNAYNNAWYSFQDQTGWSHSDVLATPLGQTPQTANLAAPNAPTSLVAPALCGR